MYKVVLLVIIFFEYLQVSLFEICDKIVDIVLRILLLKIVQKERIYIDLYFQEDIIFYKQLCRFGLILDSIYIFNLAIDKGGFMNGLN